MGFDFFPVSVVMQDFDDILGRKQEASKGVIKLAALTQHVSHIQPQQTSSSLSCLSVAPVSTSNVYGQQSSIASLQTFNRLLNGHKRKLAFEKSEYMSKLEPGVQAALRQAIEKEKLVVQQGKQDIEQHMKDIQVKIEVKQKLLETLQEDPQISDSDRELCTFIQKSIQESTQSLTQYREVVSRI